MLHRYDIAEDGKERVIRTRSEAGQPLPPEFAMIARYVQNDLFHQHRLKKAKALLIYALFTKVEERYDLVSG